jgi:anti-sigma factor RsiW
MCDFSEKLIAWLDNELTENEATVIGRHVRGCAECRSRVNSYEAAGNMFDAYCEAVMVTASKANHRQPRWIPVWAGAAATATIAALLLVFLPAPVEQLPLHHSAGTPPPAIVAKAALAPVKRLRRRASTRAQTSAQLQGANWPTGAPAIQISIPADEMFPPGAVPEGVNLVADLSVAVDGSPQQLHLRP